MKKPLLMTLSALTLALCLNTAQADQASDREEIHALLWKYTRALDTLNAEAYKATVNRLPAREEMEQGINEQLIVEFYSRF